MKQPVPLRTEVPPHGLVTTKNFIVANALETILAEPKRPKEEPLPTQKKDYGKVPRYLQTVKAKIAEEKELVASYLKAQARSRARGAVAPSLRAPSAAALAAPATDGTVP